MLISGYGQRVLNTTIQFAMIESKDYLQDPHIQTFPNEEGKMIKEVYYFLDTTEDDKPIRIFKNEKYTPDSKLPGLLLDINLRETDDSWFYNFFNECENELHSYRNVFPIIACNDDYDSSDVEEAILHFLKGVRCYEMLARGQKNEKKLKRIHNFYQKDRLLDCEIRGMNWQPHEMQLRAVHDFLRNNKYEHIRGLIVDAMTVCAQS
ncbi:MAG: hypothetical protein K6A23_12940 [Butyrivibrio sp.]|nr:hypothetical protein [Butyrivibrio sp.]